MSKEGEKTKKKHESNVWKNVLGIVVAVVGVLIGKNQAGREKERQEQGQG